VLGQLGSQISSISVAESIGTVCDFYVTDNGGVYLLSRTLYQVIAVYEHDLTEVKWKFSPHRQVVNSVL
jgi:hypothetical protein